MDESQRRAVAIERFQLTLLGAFAAIGLLLATAGIYGLISYSVAQTDTRVRHPRRPRRHARTDPLVGAPSGSDHGDRWRRLSAASPRSSQRASCGTSSGASARSMRRRSSRCGVADRRSLRRESGSGRARGQAQSGECAAGGLGVVERACLQQRAWILPSYRSRKPVGLFSRRAAGASAPRAIGHR